MKKNIFAVVHILLIGLTSFAQDNVFLERTFWKTNPSVETIDQKIKEGHNPSQPNSNNFDPVVYAILEVASNEAIIHLISQEGNSVNKITHDGRTYLFWAAYKGNVDLMEYLIKQGAKINLLDDKGNTILNFAASSGQQNTKVYDVCLQNGANLKKDLTPSGANALLLAIPKDKDFQLTSYFQSKGLDINSKDYQGNGAFNYVARTGNVDLMKQLLEKGVKGNDQAFLFAAYGTRGITNGLEVYHYLENVGLNPDVSDDEGNTPILVLASRNTNLELLTYLIKKGMDINHQNKKGQTALMLAVRNNEPSVVSFLLDQGADVSLLDAEGNNLGFYLVESYSERDKESFFAKKELLEKKGVNLAMPQKSGNTIYHLAVEKNSMPLLEMASNLTVDVNTKNGEGNTALHLAAMKAKDETILKYLLKLGAKKEILTNFQETAFDLASENELLTKNNISIDFLK